MASHPLSRNAARHDLNVLFEPRLGSSFGYVVSALLFACAGLILAVRGYSIGWCVGLLPSALCLFLLYHRISNYSTLLLTPGGFTYKSTVRTFSFRWSDVQRFSVYGGPLSKYIWFDLSDQALAQLSRTSYRLSSSQVSPDETYLPDDYGLGKRSLCELLNEWRVRFAEKSAYAGQTTGYRG